MDKANSIEIRITGKQRIGKSLLLQVIAAALKSLGYSIHVMEREGYEVNKTYEDWVKLLNEKSFRKGDKIVLSTHES